MAKKKNKKTVETAAENKIAILAELWIDYRHDEEFEDFVDYNDLGLPLAYAIDAGIVTSTPLAVTFVEETFDLLLDALDVKDNGFECLADIFEVAD